MIAPNPSFRPSLLLELLTADSIAKTVNGLPEFDSQLQLLDSEENIGASSEKRYVDWRIAIRKKKKTECKRKK